MDTLELPNKAYLLPTRIADWPPVWWFWLLLGAGVVIIIVALGVMLRRYRKRLYRREALLLVNQQHQRSEHDQAFVKCCLECIKRCLQTEGQQHLASLPPASLFPKLDQQVRHSNAPLTPLSALFEAGLYQANTTLSVEERRTILNATRTWIRKHHA